MLIRELNGHEIIAHLDQLADLRLGIFREYPYLYDGNRDGERRYLGSYAGKGLVLLALDTEQVAGAITGMSLADETPALVAPFHAAGLAPQEYFYIGELLLYAPYRKHGTGSLLLTRLEQLVEERTSCRHYCFATVVRPANHPEKPVDFVSIERFSHRHGYRLLPGVSARIAWQEIDGQTTTKRLDFWQKEVKRR